MTFETQLKIQAFLDGELPEAEAREMASLIARDPALAALHAELKHTRQALNGAEPVRQLPESREFYWSKIQREIERSERAVPDRAEVSWLGVVRGWFRPVGVVAALTLVALLALVPLGQGDRSNIVASLTDEDAITFQDEATGTTFVWFSYPAENEVAEPAAETTLE